MLKIIVSTALIIISVVLLRKQKKSLTECSGNGSDAPQDYDCETWEELLQECWEDGMNWEDVVSCELIIFEEDNS